ncbi:MAG: toll/interleukin-1 receptor domain-containing protein [Chthoniobacterales bacterium]
MPRSQLFISYSHSNRRWWKVLEEMLAPWRRPLLEKGVEEDDKVMLWIDTQLRAGDDWKAEIYAAIDRTKVAVLLVSPVFLASPFIATEELPRLMTAARTAGVRLCWVLLSDCLYEFSPLARLQAAHDIARPLDQLRPPKRARVLKEIATKIAFEYDNWQPADGPPAGDAPPPAGPPPANVVPPPPAGVMGEASKGNLTKLAELRQHSMVHYRKLERGTWWSGMLFLGFAAIQYGWEPQSMKSLYLAALGVLSWFPARYFRRCAEDCEDQIIKLISFAHATVDLPEADRIMAESDKLIQENAN